MANLKIFQLIIRPFMNKFKKILFKTGERILPRHDYQRISGFFGFLNKSSIFDKFYSKNTQRLFAAGVLASFLLVNTGFYPILAYVMGSDNYRIQSDSLNTGGGNWESGNYIFEDTMGEIASGPSLSNSYGLKAGYQQMQEVYLSVSSPADVVLTPAITGITGGVASGSATWLIKTDSPSGFDIKIKASTDPAMKQDGTYFFDDYMPASAGSPDYDWASPSASSAEFGFTIEPETAADTASLFTDNGLDTCGVGGNTNTSDKCWFDFNGASDIGIVHRTSRTDSSGESEVVKFMADSNGKFLKEGYYDATIIITVVPN